MRSLMITAAVATAALFAMPSSAYADAGTGSQTPSTMPVVNGSGWVGTSQGSAAMMTTQYEAIYTDAVVGPVDCTGVHQSGRNAPGLGQDSFTCASTTGAPLVHFVAGSTLTLASLGGWISDYYQLANGSVVYATSLSGTVSPDGMSYTGVATFYPVS